uniref:Uncharacterized protein n=1 Tax=Arundo donax TaxID=35708 RepID=A0A0A8YLN7_ARUDO
MQWQANLTLLPNALSPGQTKPVDVRLSPAQLK